MDFSLITVDDDVLIRYDALASCRGWFMYVSSNAETSEGPEVPRDFQDRAL